MENESIGKDGNNLDLFVGDFVFYNKSVYILTGKKYIETFFPFKNDLGEKILASRGDYIMGKQILSSKFKTIKKSKEVAMYNFHVLKASKQDVVESFKKIYLDWDETMKNINTAFGETDV